MYRISFNILTALLFLIIPITAKAETFFNRIASFPVNANLPDSRNSKTQTSAEIITATDDGMTLVYSDSLLKAIGLIDITKPTEPKAAGIIELKGEPTSLTLIGNKILAAVNTSKNYTTPSGHLAVVDRQSKKLIKTCDLGGQPDSIAVAPDKSFIAIAIENERNEEKNEGSLPQLPAGFATIFKLNQGKIECKNKLDIPLTGLAKIAGNDPEPEYVDINRNGEIAITLQENNHIVIVDGHTGKIITHFSAGAVDLHNIDIDEERTLAFNGTQKQRKREPDAVKWLDNERLITANEGDYEGGSRGFTIFSKSGKILYESGPRFEYAAALAGHYPEKRSANKGIEPEGLEAAIFSKTPYIFVLAERAALIGVYRDTNSEPEFTQLLPTAMGPESAIAIPKRNLLAVSGEVDRGKKGGPRAHIMLYQWGHQTANYPMIQSKLDRNNRPIGFGALSGLTADPKKPGILYAINDSFYSSQPTIFTIDANQKPAQIIKATPITRNHEAAQLLDLEGITTDGQGGFWLASEGNQKKMVMHALYHMNAKGEITQQIPFPPKLLASQKRFGAEGITRVGDALWIALQRPWQDDPKNKVKLIAYNIKTNEWNAVHYPLEKTKKGWVGLSEITYHDNHLYIVERDNQIGKNAAIKKLYRISLTNLQPAKLGNHLTTVTKEEVHDFIPNLKATSGYVADKLEGFAIDADGIGYAVTDNDGVDKSNGETLFFSIGKM